jgi:O-methyltransferase involved in polyketide biosynthesis
MSKLEGVSETLLVPLVGRARAHEWHDTFRDPRAAEIVQKLGDRLPRDLGSRRTMISSVIRAARIDDVARGYLARHPDALLLNLGAGYCTRFFRLDTGRLRCVDVDLPPVIEGKRQLLSETDRYRLVGRSLTDPAWLDEVGWTPGTPVFIAAEGVLHYLPKPDVMTFFARVRERFGAVDLVFDHYSRLVISLTGMHPRVSTGRARLVWGRSRGDEVPGAEVVSEWPIVSEMAKYDGLFRFASWVPGAKGLHGVAHVRFR